MSISLADVDISRLSARARKTLEEIAVPIMEGATEAELAEKLRTDRRSIADRRAQLAFEMQAQVLGAEIRPATDEEHEALRESIRELGQLVPAIVDDSGRIIAGNRRARVCEELGIELKAIKLSDVDAHDAGIAENLVRRHLSAGDRRRMIEAELIRRPDRSDRAIAATLGVNHETVGAARKRLEENGQVAESATRTGKDGKEQPARKETQQQQEEERDPKTRIEYIEVELRSLAELEDIDHARARAGELVLEALRELGHPELAEAYKAVVWR